VQHYTAVRNLQPLIIPATDKGLDPTLLPFTTEFAGRVEIYQVDWKRNGNGKSHALSKIEWRDIGDRTGSKSGFLCDDLENRPSRHNDHWSGDE
jgi:hypothetical protein